MILDVGANCHRYTCLHPLFERGFRYLADTDLRALAPGRHELDGDRIYVSIDHTRGRGHDLARLEAHRCYIDVQYTMEGDEEIGWMPVGDCGAPAEPYNEAKDVTFYPARPTSWFYVPTGSFAIFFPSDAHAPLGGRGAIKKAILKIAV